MKPLYRFDLDTITGKVTRLVITDYEEGLWRNNRKYMKYKDKVFKYCYLDELDRFKCNHVYSFNIDINKATEIIFNDLLDRKINAITEYKRYRDLLERLHND